MSTCRKRNSFKIESRNDKQIRTPCFMKCHITFNAIPPQSLIGTFAKQVTKLFTLFDRQDLAHLVARGKLQINAFNGKSDN